MAKKKNPVLQQKFEEGKREGFKHGFEQGKYSAIVYFASRFEGLDKVPGIGPKTVEKVVKHFGKEYFEAVKHGKNTM